MQTSGNQALEGPHSAASLGSVQAVDERFSQVGSNRIRHPRRGALRWIAIRVNAFALAVSVDDHWRHLFLQDGEHLAGTCHAQHVPESKGVDS